ncbi:hypothetical protein GQ53DRAFT_752471 [Thozetella sp. PMI_491]|nr:hypothetical protein GQ53DRAFT_752471 [Thozetella sp. PMI_491]
MILAPAPTAPIMLLPSAFSCDSQPPLTRLQSSLFVSPPASPPQLSIQPAFGNIFSTCRALQSRLASPAPMPIPSVAPISPPASSHAQLPTPPMAHTPPPMKLRLRSRKPETPTISDVPVARKRIVKRAVPARGPNKRRRSEDDDLGREDEDVESDLDIAEKDELPTEVADEQLPPRPSTPKRSRIAPEALPLGLERSDFHTLLANAGPSDMGSKVDGTDVELEADGEAWSVEDDRILVELVLEKLKLSKSDWQDCARSLGKDRGSIGRRWKSLMLNGDVGIKRTSRRGKIHSTWR